MRATARSEWLARPLSSPRQHSQASQRDGALPEQQPDWDDPNASPQLPQDDSDASAEGETQDDDVEDEEQAVHEDTDSDAAIGIRPVRGERPRFCTRCSPRNHSLISC